MSSWLFCQCLTAEGEKTFQVTKYAELCGIWQIPQQKQTQQKKTKNNFGLKTKIKEKKMEVSPQTPKGFVDKTAAETCTKETT